MRPSAEERELAEALRAARRLLSETPGWLLDPELGNALCGLAPGTEGMFDGVRVQRSPVTGFRIIPERTGHRRKKLPHFGSIDYVIKAVLLARLRSAWRAG